MLALNIYWSLLMFLNGNTLGLVGILAVFGAFPVFGEADKTPQQVDLACEISCGALKGAIEITYGEDFDFETFKIPGKWNDNAFRVSDQIFFVSTKTCRALKRFLATQLFSEMLDVKQLDLNTCETSPVVQGRFRYYTYPIVQRNKERDEL